MINNRFKELGGETPYSSLFTTNKSLFEKLMNIVIPNCIHIPILKRNYSILKNIFR